MEAHLAPDVHFAWVGDDIVALDVRNDAYLCLVGAGQGVHDKKDGRVTILEPGVFARLRDAGLAQDGPDGTARRTAPRPAPTSRGGCRPSGAGCPNWSGGWSTGSNAPAPTPGRKRTPGSASS